MGRPRKDTRMVKFAISGEAYNMFSVLAKAMGLDDVQSAIRICAMLQLTQLQTSHIAPKLDETEAQREGRATDLATRLIPELQTEPEPEHKPFGFGGSRADADDQADELAAVAAPLVVVDRPQWTGYMRGL